MQADRISTTPYTDCILEPYALGCLSRRNLHPFVQELGGDVGAIRPAKGTKVRVEIRRRVLSRKNTNHDLKECLYLRHGNILRLFSSFINNMALCMSWLLWTKIRA